MVYCVFGYQPRGLAEQDQSPGNQGRFPKDWDRLLGKQLWSLRMQVRFLRMLPQALGKQGWSLGEQEWNHP